jgi:type I restriction enzyme S subunit
MNNYVSIGELISDKISGEWGSDPISNNSVGIIRTTNFTNEGKLNLHNIARRDISENKVRNKKLQFGDVIIEKSGGSPTQPVGRVVYFDISDNNDYLCNNFTSILRPSSVVSPKYLFYGLYFLHLSKKTLAYQNKTTGIINLQLDRYIQSEKIKLPSLDEQIKILKALDKADFIKNNRKKAINLLDEYLKATFLKMFGDPVLNPMNWNTSEFSKVCLNMFGGGTPSKSNPNYYIGNIPWITPKDMKFRYISDSIDHISNEAISHSSTKLVPANSVLMVIRSGILKNKLPVAINMVDVTINQDMKAYVVDPQISNPQFVLFFFETYEKHLLEKVRAVTADNLKFDDIKSIKMIIPPMQMQNKFSLIASETEVIKKKMQRQLVEVENQFYALMQKAFN